MFRSITKCWSMTSTCVLALILVGVLVGCRAESQDIQPGQGRVGAHTAGNPPSGKEAFEEHCVICHGAEGKGDGRAAEFLFPPPRDLSLAQYRVRTTASGAMPTDEDILRTVTRGLPGSSMPSFSFLSEDVRRSLVAHVKTLAVLKDEEQDEDIRLFEEGPAPAVVALGTPLPNSPKAVKDGAEVYKRMACAKCHGETGIGDGPSSPTLVDSQGYPAPPANFARGVFKGGDTVRDIVMRFTTGMNATPMPSFVGEITPDEQWALAHYVKSLVKGEQRTLEHKSRQVVVMASGKSVPLDPAAPAWNGAKPIDIPLMLLWQRAQGSNYVTVRALRSETHVGFLLEWFDASAQGTALGSHSFSDAAGVMFALTDPPGDITMGSKDKPVNLWQWRFSRQLDMVSFRDRESLHPRMVSDDYPMSRAHYPKTASKQTPVGGAAEHSRTFLSGWGVGNRLSNPSPTSSAEDLSAGGFGTLEPQPPEGQDVEGRGVWANGKWRLVLRRPLTGTGKDVEFKGSRLYLSFAVWDGAFGDRDGQKSVSHWQILDLK